MLASDLQVSLPVVNRKTSAVVAARLIARQHASGFIVTDDGGTPVAEISSLEVLGLMLPSYLPAEDMWATAPEHTIGELLDDERVNVRGILHVHGDTPLAEVAASMVAANSQIAVVDAAEGLPRFITLPALFDAILVFAGDDGTAT